MHTLILQKKCGNKKQNKQKVWQMQEKCVCLFISQKIVSCEIKSLRLDAHFHPCIKNGFSYIMIKVLKHQI